MTTVWRPLIRFLVMNGSNTSYSHLGTEIPSEDEARQCSPCVTWDKDMLFRGVVSEQMKSLFELPKNLL